MSFNEPGKFKYLLSASFEFLTEVSMDVQVWVSYAESAGRELPTIQTTGLPLS
jgi:hypothetical protein